MSNFDKLIGFFKKNYQQIFIVFFILLMILVVYWGWFESGIIARGDWKARSSHWIQDWLNIPFAWDGGNFGGISFLNAGRIVRYPLYFVQAVFNQVFNLPYAVTERLIWFFPFLFVGAASIYLLTQKIFKNNIAGLIAVFVFLFNNFVIFRAHGAQMVLLMGASLTPLILLFFVKSLKEKFLGNVLLTGAVFALLSYNDIRLAALVLAVVIFYGLYIIFNKRFFSSDYYLEVSNKRIVGAILAIFFIFIVLNAYWILPAVFSEQSMEIAGEGSFNLGKVGGLSRTNFWHTLSLSIGDNKNFGRFVYLPGQINKGLLFLMPVIAFLSLLFAKRRREVAFWLGIYLMLAFMAKGMNPPFSFLNKIFYESVPLSSMFRLPDKFLYVMATPFAMLYGIGCAEVLKRREFFKRYFFRNFELTKVLLVAIFIFIPISVIIPAIFGGNKLADTPGGSSFIHVIPTQYFAIDDWLNNQEPHYKTAWMPVGEPRYDFFNFLHPRFETRTGVQNDSLFGSYYLNFLNYASPNPFLKGMNYLSGIKHFDKIMGLTNIKYLMIAPKDDPDWLWQTEDMASHLALLEKNNNLGLEKLSFGDDAINIFENKNTLPRIYSARQNMLILGGGKAMDYLLEQRDFQIPEWNLYFLERLDGRFDLLKEHIDTVLFFNQGLDDFLLSGIGEQYKIGKSISYNNYYKKLDSLGEIRINSNKGVKNYDAAPYKQVRFSRKIEKKDVYEVWARMAFSQGSQNAVEIVLDYERHGFFYPDQKYFGQYKWFKIASIELKRGVHNFALNVSAEEFAVDEIVVLPSEDYFSEQRELEKYLSEKRVFFINPQGGLSGFVTNESRFLENFEFILLGKNAKIINAKGVQEKAIVEMGGYYEGGQEKGLVNIIDTGSNRELWGSNNREFLNIREDPQKKENKYVNSTKSSLLYKDLELLDFSRYSHLNVRIKENIAENIALFIEDAHGRKCYFRFQSPNNVWTVYEFMLSDCRLVGRDAMDWRQIKRIGIDDIYAQYLIELDYIYLLNKNEFKDINGIKDFYFEDKDRERYSIFEVVSEEVDNKILIDYDGEYQFIFDFFTDILTQDFSQARIGDRALSVTSINNKEMISRPIHLNKGVYELKQGAYTFLKDVLAYNRGKHGSWINERSGLFSAGDMPINIIFWKMLNPSKYYIKAKVYKPSFVNFLDSYDPGWVAEYKGKESKSILLATINNSFLIEPSYEGEEIDIYLEYKPQRLMNIGFGIFVSAWALIFWYLAFSFYKNRKKRI